MKNKRVVLFLFTIILMVVWTGGCEVNRRYVKDYYEEVGRTSVSKTYEEIQSGEGEPSGKPNEINVYEEGEYEYLDAIYDDYIVHYKESIILADGVVGYRELNMIITDDQYRFGEKKIGVGSTKEEVIKAYKSKNVRIIKEEGIGVGYVEGKYDREGVTFITFNYDENDIVTSIQIVPNGP